MLSFYKFGNVKLKNMISIVWQIFNCKYSFQKLTSIIIGEIVNRCLLQIRQLFFLKFEIINGWIVQNIHSILY